MITKTRSIITLIFLFMIISCSQKEKIIDETIIKSSIKKVLSDQVNSWNNGNIDDYMQGYWKSDSLRFASGGNVTFGWESTLDRYKKGYPNKDKMGFLEFSNLDIKIISNESALVFGKWSLVREQDKPNGLFTLLFNKIKDGWKIVHDHTSSSK
ncbi:MAG: nuclear transport factor 2 family protein [Ignavibacteriae bacterium]|nr:nuclear transport factor 2 family protein [Ignavibacteriota bacterium]